MTRRAHFEQHGKVNPGKLTWQNSVGNEHCYRVVFARSSFQTQHIRSAGLIIKPCSLNTTEKIVATGFLVIPPFKQVEIVTLHRVKVIDFCSQQQCLVWQQSTRARQELRKTNNMYQAFHAAAQRGYR